MYGIKNLFCLIFHIFSTEMLVINFSVLIVCAFLVVKIYKNSKKSITEENVGQAILKNYKFKGANPLRRKNLRTAKRSAIKDLQKEVTTLKRKKLIVDNVNYEVLMESLTKNLSENKNWENFRREFKETYPLYYDTLVSDFPELTESNYRILFLKKLDFDNDEIAEYLNLTTAAIIKSLQRMRLKLGERYIHLMSITKPDF